MRARAERLAGLLGEAGIDVLIVSNIVNVRYLTGYTGSNGLALVGARTRTFLTDFRHCHRGLGLGGDVRPVRLVPGLAAG